MHTQGETVWGGGGGGGGWVVVTTGGGWVVLTSGGGSVVTSFSTQMSPSQQLTSQAAPTAIHCGGKIVGRPLGNGPTQGGLGASVSSGGGASVAGGMSTQDFPLAPTKASFQPSMQAHENPGKPSSSVQVARR